MYESAITKRALPNKFSDKVKEFGTGGIGDFLSELYVQFGDIDEARSDEEVGDGNVELALLRQLAPPT